MKVGYARVSTLNGQSTDPQEARLREAGCRVIFCDTGQSGAKEHRPGWANCLAFLSPGDVLIAVRLDRFGRSVQHLLNLADDMRRRDIGIRCLDQGEFDTTTSVGKLLFGILSCVAAFERDLAIERINDGLAVARANGKVIGSPRALDSDQERIAVQLRAGGMKPESIARTMRCSRSTVYRVLQRAESVPESL